MATPYDNWKQRLDDHIAGRKCELMTYETEPEAGYWRYAVKDKTAGGASITTDWHPVAFWPKDNGLVGVIGRNGIDQRNLDHDGCISLWKYVCNRPISYETYNLVAEEGGAWPDAHKLKQKDAPAPAAPAQEAQEPAAPAEPEEKIILKDIADYDAQIKAFTKIETEAQNTEVSRLRGVVAGLRLKSERAQKAESAPHWKLYKEAMDRWNPPINAAKRAEAVAKSLQDDWQTTLARIAKQDAERERQRQQQEAQQADQWVDRALAAQQNGEEAPPLPPELPKAAPSAPAPSTHTQIGSRRKPVRDVKHVTITDIDALFAHFKQTEAVRTVLQQLAQAKVNAGETDIPGISIEERKST